MKLRSSTSARSGSLVKLATTLAVLLLIIGHLPTNSALVPSGGEKRPTKSNVLFCGSSWRKMFLASDHGCSGSESLSIYSTRKLPSRSLKAGKVPPSPPSPTQNQRAGMATPPPFSLKL
ncbi:Uncharacterized protein TCM_012184 [Theobroma cacao]|uniref:Secreted protein n=1 Tax=Theobroma cacao TaxID=3641 RepID=A0A061FTU4_THECC|nr:Uncharacterized protein TCM_012184 [Theobroma cacao]